MNNIYLVTGKLTKCKGLYNINIYIKIFLIRKHMSVCVYAIMFAYLYFMSNLYTGNTASILILLTSHVKLAYLSTLNKRTNAIYYMNFRDHYLCDKLPIAISKNKFPFLTKLSSRQSSSELNKYGKQELGDTFHQKNLKMIKPRRKCENVFQSLSSSLISNLS